MQPSAHGRHTLIIATIGPASRDPRTLDALAQAGMDIARVNFSHATHEEAASIVSALRTIAPEVAILGDLQGRKRRIGPLPHSLPLRAGQSLLLAVEAGHGTPSSVSTDLAELGVVSAGIHIAVGDGVIELEVLRSDAAGIHTAVLNDGLLTSRAGVYIPDSNPMRAALTEQDRDDLAFAVGQEMEWLALSFVAGADDVLEARRALDELSASDTQLMAKIERHSALLQLDAIAAASDGVMVARGDLGVAVGVAEVPSWQRRIVRAGERAGRPVVVATEMLESMVTSLRPTRAEASDIANAVWEGAAGLLLSAETAIGAHPVEVVRVMDRIIRAAEADMPQRDPTLA